MTKEQFSELVSQYERLVYTVCFQLVRDASAAEDLTQETFLAAWLHRDAVPRGYERQWLGRIAANMARGLAPPAEEVALQKTGVASIAAEIEALKEPYRPVCRLCLLEEKSPEEAALALGRPVKTVHTQLSRGKRLLREKLERSGGYGTVPH